MQPPGPSAWTFIRAVRKQGFLEAVGVFWKQYGDVFRVRLAGQTLVFAMHPDAVVRASITHRDRYDKGRSMDAVRKFMLGNGLVTSTGEVWQKQRRLMAPFFTPKGILAYADLITQDAVTCRDRWRELTAKPSDDDEVEVSEEMAVVTASIILKAVFSTQNNDAIHEFKHAVEVMIDFVNDSLTSPPLPLWMPTPRNRAFVAARRQVMGTVADLVAQRRAMDHDEWPNDLMSRLMDARDEEGQPMSESMLLDEALTLFVAGYETTARTLTFAWHALARQPEVAERLHEELDRVLGGRVPTLEDLKQLRYTMQVVKEVMRLHPPAPFYAKDAVVDDEIGGFEVPADTLLLLSPYYTQRHPDHWPAPEAFDPSRWEPEREREMHDGAYLPFSIGQRICIGKHLALLESQILLAVLAQEFVPELRPGYEPQWFMRGVLNLEGGLPMRLRRRVPQTPRATERAVSPTH